MKGGAAALIAAASALLAAAPAGAELAEPVSVTATAPALVAINAPFKLDVEVKAEAGALEIASQPLRLRVKAEPECGGSFAGTEGPTLIDRALKAPSPGAAYSADVVANVKLGALGETTICAFLEDAQERQYATDTEETVTVIPGCGVSSRSLAKLRKRLKKTNLHLAQVHKRARHADGARRRALLKRRHRLAKQRQKLLRKLRVARHQTQVACGSRRVITRVGRSR